MNNEHASESKCTYFMAGEQRKWVNYEIYHEIDINLELLYRWKQPVKNVSIIQMEAANENCFFEIVVLKKNKQNH